MGTVVSYDDLLVLYRGPGDVTQPAYFATSAISRVIRAEFCFWDG